MTSSLRCDDECSALRWPMHCAALGNALRCDNRRRTRPCGKEQRKAFCPPRLPSAKVACHSLAGCCRLGRFHPFGGFSKRSRNLWERLFLFYPKTVPAESGFPPFPGSNRPREPLDEDTTRSEAAQVILHRMLKEVWHSITLPFVKRNRGRKPPLVGTGILPLIKTKPPLPAGGENSSLLFSSK